MEADARRAMDGKIIPRMFHAEEDLARDIKGPNIDCPAPGSRRYRCARLLPASMNRIRAGANRPPMRRRLWKRLALRRVGTGSTPPSRACKAFEPSKIACPPRQDGAAGSEREIGTGFDAPSCQPFA